MKTDTELKNMINHIINLRAYDDNMSILIRLKIIEELNIQIKNIMIHNKIIDDNDSNSNLKKYLHKRIDDCENDLDVSTLMHVFDFIRDYSK